MATIRKRYIVLALVLCFTLILVNVFNYEPFQKADAGVSAIRNIPLQIGKWRGRDVPLDAQVYEILETKSIINRAYFSQSGKEVFLSLVFYPQTKVDFHAPEACLGGRGVKTSKSPREIQISCNGNVKDIDLNQILHKDEDNTHLVYYFYKTGKFVGRSYIKLRFALAANTIFERERSGSLVRVSTVLTPGKEEEAEETLRDFIEQLYPYLLKYL
jgi:EpsI family protein